MIGERGAFEAGSRVVLGAGEDGVATGAFETIGIGIDEILSVSHVLGVVVQLALLFLLFRLYEGSVRRLVRWRLEVGRTLARWLPTARLVFGAFAFLVVLEAFTPADPTARTLVAVGVVVALVWSARDVVRNAAAGAIVIARQAVREGDHLRVGPHHGRVVTVTLRGVQIETPDGSRTFLPGTLLHTEAATWAPGRAHSEPITFDWALPPPATKDEPQTVLALVRRLALLSPRRAPGTPVLVAHDESGARLRVTATPFSGEEAESLRIEIVRRLHEAWVERSPEV